MYNAKKPYGAQDLRKGEQEKMVSFILKSDSRDIHERDSQSLKFIGQGNECKDTSRILRSRNIKSIAIHYNASARVNFSTTAPAEVRQSFDKVLSGNWETLSQAFCTTQERWS